jgi:hypothetical protein
MAIQSYLLFSLLLVFGSCFNSLAATQGDTASFNRKSFPQDFVFGVASSAYQVRTFGFLSIGFFQRHYTLQDLIICVLSNILIVL